MNFDRYFREGRVFARGWARLRAKRIVGRRLEYGDGSPKIQFLSAILMQNLHGSIPCEHSS